MLKQSCFVRTVHWTVRSRAELRVAPSSLPQGLQSRS